MNYEYKIKIILSFIGFLFFQEPIYQRTRELLHMKTQLMKISDDYRRELKYKASRNTSTTNRLTSPIHI